MNCLRQRDEGRGSFRPVVGAGADTKQRIALSNILTGKETEPLATSFALYSAMCDTIYDPIITTIDIEIDMESRTARCEAKGAANARGDSLSRQQPGDEN